MKKQCFKCSRVLSIKNFYKHSQLIGGHLNKCIDCTKKDNKESNGIHQRICTECKKQFFTTLVTIKEGGGHTCSRECWKKRFIKIVKRDDKSPNWLGDKVGMKALHDWVKREFGSPPLCQNCGKIGKKTKGRWKGGKWNIDWANISRKYKRDKKDWCGLCRKCHSIFDINRLTLKQLKKWKGYCGTKCLTTT